MLRPPVLPSTTSHKQEPLLPTLEVFSRLGLLDLDLNLGHLVEGGMSADVVRRALDAHGQRVWIVSGGWCDFFHGAPQSADTTKSVDVQVGLARDLGVSMLRLFYGRLPRADWTAEALDAIGGNLLRLSDRYPDITFVMENHGRGASSDPDVCAAVLERVGRANVRMNFDPINFEHAGIDSMRAFERLRPHIAHVHLKGTIGGQCAEFGVGDVDLAPLLAALASGGYAGWFTVEYEGPFDRTVRLYESVRRAREALASLQPGSVSADAQ
jgi:sugar phosphate isomerase/epimerase